MIVREIVDFRVLDATTNSPVSRLLTYTPVLAPLLDWSIEIYERRFVLIEPQSGSVGNPDPNAFMIIEPPSFAVGNIFGIELIGTDWEAEGFAVGDVLNMAMGPIVTNSLFLRATILGISGTTATMRIDTIHLATGTLNTQNPFPLVAFLNTDRFSPRAALLRAGDSGFTSPLNGQPFYATGHANHIPASVVGPAIETLLYNLRYYDANQESIISAVIPNARNMRGYRISCRGSQFYAYRSSLNPTANTPTSAYPTRGEIVLEAQAPNPNRDISFRVECLLLHPNRLGETNTFTAPGNLTITGGSGSISAPSIPSPIRQAICLLGPDSHHSLPNIPSSTGLTQPTNPPSLPTPRTGADYVGVVTGQIGGEWVAVMTNRIPTTPPVHSLQIITENLELARYDAIVLTTTEESARLSGTYIVILYGIIGGRPVPLANYELNINAPVPVSLPDRSRAIEALGMLFPFEYKLPSSYAIRTANYDVVITDKDPHLGTRTIFYVPIPSGQEPPALSGIVQPPSGYLRDIWPFLDDPKTIVAQVICPDGTLLESPPTELGDQPRADNRLAVVSESATEVRVRLTPPFQINRNEALIYFRVALFEAPAGHRPIDQAMRFDFEDYTLGMVLDSYFWNGTRVRINRNPLSGYTYEAIITKTGLRPGRYVVHVRSECEVLRGRREYESFLYEFVVSGPEDPVGTPLPDTKCKVNIPALNGEEWPYIVRREGFWLGILRQVRSCTLNEYCGCFEVVPRIPDEWIDIIGYFRGSVKGLPINDGSRHKARFRGRIIRLDDEYSTEDFVSSVYRREDIVRAYSGRYQVEIFAQTPCDLANIDILKFAAWWDVVNRSNRLLPNRIYYLRPSEVSIADSGDHAKVTIALKELKWRDEYRRQG